MQVGWTEKYKGYNIMLESEKVWLITNDCGYMKRLPTWESPFRYVDEAILGEYEEEEE